MFGMCTGTCTTHYYGTLRCTHCDSDAVGQVRPMNFFCLIIHVHEDGEYIINDIKGATALRIISEDDSVRRYEIIPSRLQNNVETFLKKALHT